MNTPITKRRLAIATEQEIMDGRVTDVKFGKLRG